MLFDAVTNEPFETLSVNHICIENNGHWVDHRCECGETVKRKEM